MGIIKSAEGSGQARAAAHGWPEESPDSVGRMLANGQVARATDRAIETETALLEGKGGKVR